MSKTYQPLACIAPLTELFARGAAGDLDHAYDFGADNFRGLNFLLQEAHCFEFDFADWMQPEEEAKIPAQFSADCVTKGVFQPPFDVTLLQWPDAPLDGRKPENRILIGSEETRRAVAYYPHEGMSRAQWAVAMIVTLVRNGVETELGRLGGLGPSDGALIGWRAQKKTVSMLFGFCVPHEQPRIAVLQDMTSLISFDSGVEFVCGENAPWPREHAKTYHFLRDEFWRPLTGRSALEMAQLDGSVTLRSVLYFMGTLSSRGPRERKMVPRPEVVAKREREKKAPWVSYSVVSLPGLSQAAGEGTGRTLDGKRSSPRIHWRRGHPRHLASGRIVPIPPMLVGVSELGEVIASYHAK